MLQYLFFDKSKVQESEFRIISDRDAVKFFLKRFLWLVILVYSTLFLAVAIPFENAYYIGAFIIILFLFRVGNHVIQYRRFKGGGLKVTPEGMQVFSGEKNPEIPAREISFIEINIFGNLVIHQKSEKTIFPIMLISDGERQLFLSLFMDSTPWRTLIIKKIWDFCDAIFVAFVLAMHIRQYIIQAYYIPTGSMEETLQIGDHILVEKLTYGPIVPRMIGMSDSIHLSCIGMRDVRRGDIVIFVPPHDKKYFIKRCIAVPRDDFRISNGSVYINGTKIDEPYTKGYTNYTGFGNKRIDGKVPDNHIIVLGDNRENSLDSREFGYLNLKRVEGKAFILYWNTRHIFNFDFSRLGLIR